MEAVGQKSAHRGLRRLVLVVIIIETFATFSSHWVNGTSPAKPFAHIVDAPVAVSLQAAVVVQVLVLFEHFLSNPLQHVVAAYPRQDALQSDRLDVQRIIV